MNRPWFEFIKNPKPEDVGDVFEIAHALSMQCRFLGRVKKFYSVAQHSVYVSRLVPQRHALFALFHDASEAFLGDVATPVKDVVRPLYGPMEDKVMVAISEKFGFDMLHEAEKSVKVFDLVMLVTEARDVALVSLDRDLSDSIRPLPLRIEKCWSPKRAKMNFVNRFGEIMRANGGQVA